LWKKWWEGPEKEAGGVRAPKRSESETKVKEEPVIGPRTRFRQGTGGGMQCLLPWRSTKRLKTKQLSHHKGEMCCVTNTGIQSEKKVQQKGLREKTSI